MVHKSLRVPYDEMNYIFFQLEKKKITKVRNVHTRVGEIDS